MVITLIVSLARPVRRLGAITMVAVTATAAVRSRVLRHVASIKLLGRKAAVTILCSTESIVVDLGGSWSRGGRARAAGGGAFAW